MKEKEITLKFPALKSESKSGLVSERVKAIEKNPIREYHFFFRGLDVTPITLALSGASAYPRACQALSSMLSRKALNPADMTIVST